ncbi:MAG: cytochrome c-type biogenesis protein [Pseudomonadota bacterium]
MRIVALFLLLPIVALAQDVNAPFDDPELQARYDKIVDEVRCLKCQNQSLRDSGAFLAADLKREIRRMLNDGMSDQEIYDFLVARYGEFALYRPRMQGKTLVLWLAPGVLLLGGGVALFFVLRRRMTLPIDDEPQEQN